MTDAEKILEKYPCVKLGLDDHYGKQTVLNALNEALHINNVVQNEQLCNLNGKTVRVKFKVTKHIPKIIIEDI